jgi:DNA-binding transcriptional ArsR family regulator
MPSGLEIGGVTWLPFMQRWVFPMAQLINPSTTSPQGAGAILSLIREGPRTRSELVDLTGMARSTASQRLRTLLDQELLA